MLEKKYKNIVYITGLTIVATIAIQFYWNLKIYHVNKQQLNNQVQVSFDKAIESYYNHLAKANVLTFIDSDTIFEGKRALAMFRNSNVENQLWIDGIIDSANSKKVFKIRSEFSQIDSVEIQQFNIPNFKHISIFEGQLDTLELRHLTTKIMFSFTRDIINLSEIDSFLNDDLNKKNIDIRYGFKFGTKNRLTNKITIEELKLEDFSKNYESISANSSFLPHNSKLQLLYTDTTITILKSMLGSIFLSFLLSIFIIGCLLFLLKIIFKQKQLSEVKNDFINNITHEFKTPISTISIALEGLENFDILKDEVKKKQYLKISNEQLGRLNQMVEKLLETATLKTDQFELKKEAVNLSELIKNITEKHQFSNRDKSISLTVENDIYFKVDEFHFENALNNILDNAIKYGGNHIIIKVLSTKKNIEISIEDNGNGIENKYKQKIFDQFYRIPTGNIHDVKGFGIGLYYTKNIIEKHGGKVFVSENKKGKVVFKIILNYGN